MPAPAPWEVSATAMPVFPLKGTALMPGTPHVFEIGRERSIQAVQSAFAKKTKILAIAQRNEDAYDPTAGDLWPAGTIAIVQAVSKLPNSTIKATVLGEKRAWLRKFAAGTAHAIADAEPMKEEATPQEAVLLMRQLKQLFEQWTKTQKTIETPFGTMMVPVACLTQMRGINEPVKLVDVMSAYLPLTGQAKQRILELPNPLHRVEFLLDKLQAAVAPPNEVR